MDFMETTMLEKGTIYDRKMDKDVLRRWRVDAGLSQQALAGILRVSLRCIQKWEQGASKIPYSVELAWPIVMVKAGTAEELRIDRAKQQKKRTALGIPLPDGWTRQKIAGDWFKIWDGRDGYAWDHRGYPVWDAEALDWRFDPYPPGDPRWTQRRGATGNAVFGPGWGKGKPE